MGISSTDSWTVWLILGRVFTLHSYLDMTTETDGDDNLNDIHDSIQNYCRNLYENRDDNANSRDLEHDLDFEEELEFVNDWPPWIPGLAVGNHQGPVVGSDSRSGKCTGKNHYIIQCSNAAVLCMILSKWKIKQYRPQIIWWNRIIIIRKNPSHTYIQWHNTKFMSCCKIIL